MGAEPGSPRARRGETIQLTDCRHPAPNIKSGDHSEGCVTCPWRGLPEDVSWRVKGGQLELERRGPGREESRLCTQTTCFCSPAVGLQALLLPCEVEVLCGPRLVGLAHCRLGWSAELTVLMEFVGRIAGRTPLPSHPPDTRRQRSDLGSGREDLDQSCLGLGGGAERWAGAMLAGPGVPQGG